MKKLLLLSVLFLNVICVSLSARIVYRQATVDDLEEMLALQVCIEQEPAAAHALVVFPAEVRRDILHDALDNDNFFVAVDSTSKQIVSFLKMYYLDASNRSVVLHDELGFDPDKEPSFVYLEKCRDNQVLTGITMQLSNEEINALCAGTNDCLYFYYGGAYTVPAFRNRNIQTELIGFALDKCGPNQGVHVRAADLDIFESIKFVALVYGQVHNEHQRMIRAFNHFLGSIGCAGDVCLQHIGYPAIKPEFVLQDDGTLKPRFLPENKGTGNMLVFRLPEHGDDDATPC